MEKQYLLPNGATVRTLKDVRKVMKCSGRAIKHLMKDNTIQKIEVVTQNVQNDGNENNG